MMATTRQYFEKAGGKNLLKQYVKTGVFCTAMMQFLFLGKTKTALEILRLSVSLKLKMKLSKQYRNVLNKFDNGYVEDVHQKSNKVWVFWWQGIENAPDLVKFCYKSVLENLNDWDVVLITKNNYLQYTEFPNCIIEKLESEKITLTHFSDLLRLELLIRHGGLWLDATVLCTNGNLSPAFLNGDLFMFRPQKPGANGRALTLSSWLMYATTNNRILMTTRALLYDYWEKNDSLIDYFLLHYFMSIVLDHYQEDSRKIYPYDSSIPHLLQLHLFDNYNPIWWEDWKRLSCFHKLSYKFSKEDTALKGTYYDIIFHN